MKNEVVKNQVLQDDILRYKKNKIASTLALCALVFNCLYFMLFYAVHSTKVYTPLVGLSVIVNLLVLLAGFYSSEGIKNYNKKFAIALLVLAVIQIIRIFIYPTMGMAQGYLEGNHYFFFIKMTNASNGTLMIIYLVASAAFFVAAAVHGYLVAHRLETFSKKLANGEVSVEDELKKLDEEDAAKEVAAADVAETAEAVPASDKAEEEAPVKEDDNG